MSVEVSQGIQAVFQGQHNELGLQNVGGVFVLLLGGLVIAFIIAIFEFIYKVPSLLIMATIEFRACVV